MQGPYVRLRSQPQPQSSPSQQGGGVGDGVGWRGGDLQAWPALADCFEQCRELAAWLGGQQLDTQVYSNSEGPSPGLS